MARSPPWCGDEGAVLPSVDQPFVRVAALAMTVEPTVAEQELSFIQISEHTRQAESSYADFILEQKIQKHV